MNFVLIKYISLGPINNNKQNKMNNKVLIYAKTQIEETDQSVKVLVINFHLYIESNFGKVYKLSEDEIFNLATDYLQNEINSLKHI